MDYLPSELIHDIGMWNAGLLHRNKLKQVLMQITHHHQVIRASTSYKLKYATFEYYMHYDHVQYVRVDIGLGPQKYEHKWGKEQMIKHDPV